MLCMLVAVVSGRTHTGMRLLAFSYLILSVVIAALLLCCPSQADCLLSGYCFSSVFFFFAKVC